MYSKDQCCYLSICFQQHIFTVFRSSTIARILLLSTQIFANIFNPINIFIFRVSLWRYVYELCFTLNEWLRESASSISKISAATYWYVYSNLSSLSLGRAQLVQFCWYHAHLTQIFANNFNTMFYIQNKCWHMKKCLWIMFYY